MKLKHMPQVGSKSMQVWLDHHFHAIFIEFGMKHNGMFLHLMSQHVDFKNNYF